MGTIVLTSVETVSQKIPEYTWINKPSAAEFGKGQLWFSDLGAIGYSDGTTWSVVKHTRKYKPSSFVAIKSATTTVANQSEKIATGAKSIYIKNLDSTNTVKIGFGTSYTTAESAAAASTAIGLPNLEFNFPIPAGSTHYSWLGVGGTVSVIIGQDN